MNERKAAPKNADGEGAVQLELVGLSGADERCCGAQLALTMLTNHANENPGGTRMDKGLQAD